MEPPRSWMGSYNEMVDAYQGESDRAAAILGGSFVDFMLEDLLKQVLVADKAVAEMFSGDRALATFSAKIGLAFALGLLPPNVRMDLDKIRKIRNHFAHHPTATTFADAPARDICRTLSVADPKSGVATSTAAAMDARQIYLMTIAGLAVYFDRVATLIRSGKVARPVVPAPLRLFTDGPTTP